MLLLECNRSHAYPAVAVTDCVLTARADTVHDPLFGDAQGSASTASRDPRDLPRRVSTASAGVDRDHFADEDAGAADTSEMQAWTLSSLEATPQEALTVAAMDGDEGSVSTADVWDQLGSSAGRSAGHAGARFPSGFVVDDLQSSGAGLPLRASLAAAAKAASGSRSVVEAVHDLHDPTGRGTGALHCHPGIYVQTLTTLQQNCVPLMIPSATAS